MYAVFLHHLLLFLTSYQNFTGQHLSNMCHVSEKHCVHMHGFLCGYSVFRYIGIYVLLPKNLFLEQWMVNETELRVIHYTLGPLKPWDWWTSWLLEPVRFWQVLFKERMTLVCSYLGYTYFLLQS